MERTTSVHYQRLGGPFDTVSDYLKAWAREAKFAHSPNRIKELCGHLGDEVCCFDCTVPSTACATQ